LYTELFYAIIPTLFLCFLLICYPYILLHFLCFYSCTIEASGRGIWKVRMKMKIRKFLLKDLWPFIRKFAPTKISRYTVLPISTLT